MKLCVVVSNGQDVPVIKAALARVGLALDDDRIRLLVREPGHVQTSAHLSTLTSVARTAVFVRNEATAVIVVSECDPYRRPADWCDAFREGMDRYRELVEVVSYDQILGPEELDRIASFALRKLGESVE